jgi:DNA-binding CsgD family transcriptional regulator
MSEASADVEAAGAALDPAVAIGELYRGLFDRDAAQPDLAPFAAAFGAAGAAILRRQPSGRLRALGPWHALPGARDAMRAPDWVHGVLQLALATPGRASAGRLADLGRAAHRAGRGLGANAPKCVLTVAWREVRGRTIVPILWRERPFGPREEALLDGLARELQRAVNLCERAAKAMVRVRFGAALLDQLGVPLAMVDARRHVHVANAAARALLESDSELVLAGRNLTARNRAAAARLAAAIRAATGAIGAPRAAVIRTGTGEASGGRAIHVLPLGAGRSRAAGATLALLCFEPARAGAVAQLPAFTGAGALTAAESRVLARVLAGDRPRQAARALGVAETTVRAHLRSLYDKTGCRGLAALTARFHLAVGAVAGRDGAIVGPREPRGDD